MREKNPFDTSWNQEPYYVQAVRRAEEREEYLANLFHLPGRNLDHPDFLIECLLPARYLPWADPTPVARRVGAVIPSPFPLGEVPADSGPAGGEGGNPPTENRKPRTEN
jgi:hypothetical protein